MWKRQEPIGRVGEEGSMHRSQHNRSRILTCTLSHSGTIFGDRQQTTSCSRMCQRRLLGWSHCLPDGGACELHTGQFTHSLNCIQSKPSIDIVPAYGTDDSMEGNSDLPANFGSALDTSASCVLVFGSAPTSPSASKTPHCIATRRATQ